MSHNCSMPGLQVAKEKAPKPAKQARGPTGAAAYEAALLRKRIEAVKRLQAQMADPASVASQTVAAYSDVLDGVRFIGNKYEKLNIPSPRDQKRKHSG